VLNEGAGEVPGGQMYLAPWPRMAVCMLSLLGQHSHIYRVYDGTIHGENWLCSGSPTAAGDTEIL